MRTTIGRVAIVSLLVAAPGALARASGHRFTDDYPRALAEARARHVPLFVDAWAPW